MSTTEPARLLELDADTARLVERLRGVGGTDAIGYGHGLPRHAGNTATMVAAPAEGTARALPIVGRVAMDDAVVLIDEVPLVAGDHLSVFGPGSGETPLDQWSAMVDDDPVSVLLALDPRITTVVCDDA